MKRDLKNRIRSQEFAGAQRFAGGGSGTSWAAVFCFVAVSSGMFYGAVQSGDSLYIIGEGIGALVVLIYLVGKGMHSFGQARFGDVRLELEAVPVVAGGRLRASLRLPKNAASAKTVETVLTCFVVTVTRDGGTEKSLRWEQRDVFAVGLGRIAKIAIDIPSPQLISELIIPNAGEMGNLEWELKVESAVDGLDFMRSYEVKVNAAAASAAAAPRAAPRRLTT